jgi:hypothetical protein
MQFMNAQLLWENVDRYTQKTPKKKIKYVVHSLFLIPHPI